MSFFLLIIILSLSQHIFSMNYSLRQMKQYENKGMEEILRGHPELLAQILNQENMQKTPRKTTNNPVLPLKGSTEKVNDNK